MGEGEEDGQQALQEERRGGRGGGGFVTGVVRGVLGVFVNCMYGLRQTGPFLDFEAASKPLGTRVTSVKAAVKQ